MTTVSSRRAARAALALGFLSIAAFAQANVIVSTVLPVTTGTNPGATYEFQSGTLQDTSGGTYTNAVQIDPNFNGTIDANGNTSTWSGLFTGTGNLLTLQGTGGGMITLSGANTYTGVTEIDNLQVGIGNASAFGTGSLSLNGATLLPQSSFVAPIANNGLLTGVSNVINANGFTNTFSGTFFGSGGLSIAGAGQINLTGTSFYTGGTTVNAGLKVGLANSGFGSGSVSLLGGNTLQLVGATNAPNAITFAGGATIDANGNAGTFSGPIGGAGGLTFVDTSGTNLGVVTLGGAGSAWTGGTTINGGTAALGAANGVSPSGFLTVGPNGTFNMNGFAQQINAAVANNGAIMTGAGALSVNGNYTAGPASALSLFPVFNAPSLNVTGTAALGTGQETLTVQNRPATGVYTVVQATTLTGTFSSINIPTGYLDSFSYNASNQLVLSLTAPSLILPGQTRNQSAIAGGLNSANAASSADLSSVISSLNTLAFTSPAAFNAQLNEIGPIAYSALSGLSHAGTGAQMEAINRRVNALQAGLGDAAGDRVAVYGNGSSSPGVLVAEGGGGPVPAPEPTLNPLDDPWGLYASALYATGRLSGENGAAGFQPGYGFDSYGGMMGADYRFSDNFAAGFSLGYVGGKANLDGYGGAVTNDSLLFGAYATVWDDNFHASGYLGTSMDSFSTSRNLPDFGRTATAKPEGSDLKLDASGGWDFKEGRAVLSPYFGLTYDRQHTAAFGESGAGALDLDVASLATNSLRSTFGAKLSRKYKFDWFSITPSVDAGWQHEFADQSRAISAEFSGAGGGFAVDTADVSRDALLAGIALTMDMTENVSLRLGYSGDYRSDFNSKTADFGLRARF